MVGLRSGCGCGSALRRRTGVNRIWLGADPDALSRQLPIIVDVLSAVGIVMKWADGYEADDISARWRCSHRASRGGHWKRTCSSSSTTRGYLVARHRQGRVPARADRRGRSHQALSDPRWSYAAFAALRGEPSDGPPGVPGVGEKDGRRADPPRRVEVMVGAIDAGHGRLSARSCARSWSPHGITCRLACRWSWWPRTCWSSCPAENCPRRLPIRPGSRRSTRAGKLGSSLGRVLSALAAAPQMTGQREGDKVPAFAPPSEPGS